MFGFCGWYIVKLSMSFWVWKYFLFIIIFFKLFMFFLFDRFFVEWISNWLSFFLFRKVCIGVYLVFLIGIGWIMNVLILLVV